MDVAVTPVPRRPVAARFVPVAIQAKGERYVEEGPGCWIEPLPFTDHAGGRDAENAGRVSGQYQPRALGARDV